MSGVQIAIRARQIFEERARAESEDSDFDDDDFEDLDLLRISQGVPSPPLSPQPEYLPTIAELARQWGSFWKKETATPPCFHTSISRRMTRENVYNERKREATPFKRIEKEETLMRIPIVPVNDNHFPEAGNFEFVFRGGELQLVGARFAPDLSKFVMM